MNPIMRNKGLLLAAVLALPLSACLGLKPPKPPATLFTLTAPQPASLPARRAAAGNAVTIAVPTVPATLQTVRIPVQTSATEFAYLKHGQWMETPNQLFARLLSDTVSTRTNMVVLDPRQTTHDPGHRLTGQLLAFDLDMTDRANPHVHVRYDAALTLAGDGGVNTRRFEVTLPVAAQDEHSVSRALNDAANQVAVQVAQWLASLPLAGTAPAAP